MSSFRTRLETLRATIDAEIERSKPVQISLSLNDGAEEIVSPIAAIDFIWSRGLGTIRSIETDFPEYVELAGALNAVFGIKKATENQEIKTVI